MRAQALALYLDAIAWLANKGSVPSVENVMAHLQSNGLWGNIAHCFLARVSQSSVVEGYKLSAVLGSGHFWGGAEQRCYPQGQLWSMGGYQVRRRWP